MKSSRKRAAADREKQIRSKATIVGPPPGSRPRFVADVMLGRLARWLRIAGFDVLYSNCYTDDELVALSRREGRILLSRDTRLLVRRAVNRFVYLESDGLENQLGEVLRKTEVTELPGLLSRCLDCNCPLEDVAREAIRDRVPPYVYETQPSFKRCPRCAKVFWAGTHRSAVVRTLEKLLSRTAQL